MARLERSIVVKTPRENLFEVITDFERYPEFLPEIKEVTILSARGSSYEVEFQVEFVRRFTYTLALKGEPPERLRWTMISGDFKKNDGGWLLKARSDYETEAIYDIDLDIGFRVPATITKKITEFSLPATLKRFKERAEMLLSEEMTIVPD